MVFQAVIFSAFVALCMAHGIVQVHEHHAPQPYGFGYSVKDHHGEQHRQEVGDGHGNVKGNYGFSDARGIQRQVDYVADHGGFRAQVKTNEPGTANQDPAAVNVISTAPYGGGYGGVGLGYGAGLGYVDGRGGAGYGAGLGYVDGRGGAGYGAGLGYVDGRGGAGYGVGLGGLGYGGLGYGAVGGLGLRGGAYSLGNGGIVYGLGSRGLDSGLGYGGLGY